MQITLYWIETVRSGRGEKNKAYFNSGSNNYRHCSAYEDCNQHRFYTPFSNNMAKIVANSLSCGRFFNIEDSSTNRKVDRLYLLERKILR